MARWGRLAVVHGLHFELDVNPPPNQGNPAYPFELQREEARLLEFRPKWEKTGRTADGPVRVGVGLSGGGIRSATFCLGVFQALARRGKLGEIDYLSTVSGGGYFGSAYGRLFTREETTSVGSVEDALGKVPENPFLRWLRDNGRYLAPRGGGDLLLSAATTLRNWVAVQMLLLVLALAFFCAVQLARHAVIMLLASPEDWRAYSSYLDWELPGGIAVWGSPFVPLPLLALLVAAVPAGWAYWVLPSDSREARPSWPTLGGMAIVLAVGALFARAATDARVRIAGIAAVVTAACAIVAALMLLVRLGWQARSGTPEADVVRVQEIGRQRSSRRLQQALTVTVVLAVLVIIDSFGQTFYALAMLPDQRIGKWFGGILPALGGITALVARMIPLARGDGKTTPMRGALPALATIAALALAMVLLTGVDLLSHGIAWQFRCPRPVPASLARVTPPPLADASAVRIRPVSGDGRTLEVETQPSQQPGEDPGVDPAKRPEEDQETPEEAQRRLCLLGLASLALMALALVCGRAWPFLNFSTQLPMYRARLAHAYLGASNSTRLNDGVDTSVTRALSGDDQNIEQYYGIGDAASQRALFGKGAPLHLINTTINETIDGRSQVETQDRKGVPLAIGPCAMSAGVQHHMVIDSSGHACAVCANAKHQVFDQGTCTGFPGEPMTLGRWLAISGAAFSTGIGYRTSLGLSLLAGLGNVRLGYWWDSKTSIGFQSLLRKLSRGLLPVQLYLCDELLARFRGTTERYWYLSDGGHFENLGGYELVRRRLPLIVLVDAEADPDFTFAGLSDLVMKARVDFNAEITFLDTDALDALLDPAVRACFGTLEELRRGPWSETLGPIEPSKRRVLKRVEHERVSWRHASIAQVRYATSDQMTWIVYVKATMTGDEPLDVKQYHHENPTFPHQTTGDQFFDERQWESYRKLGEHIAAGVFAVTPSAEGGWLPGSFRPPGA